LGNSSCHFSLKALTHSVPSRTLESNNLTTLQKDAFEELTKLKQISLGDNPLICDCHLIWLSRWQRKFSKSHSNAKCNSPYHMRDKTVDEVLEADLKCSGKTYTIPSLKRFKWDGMDTR
jgi:hypothetical protein